MNSTGAGAQPRSWTGAFFYGLADGDDIEVEVAPGTRHAIGLRGRATAAADGVVTLFFALDGQLLLVRVATAASNGLATRARVQDGNPAHIGAGVVVAVAVRPGQQVARGEPLLAIEAMKMQTQIVAERDLTVAEVCVEPGDAVRPGDLLIVLK